MSDNDELEPGHAERINTGDKPPGLWKMRAVSVPDQTPSVTTETAVTPSVYSPAENNPFALSSIFNKSGDQSEFCQEPFFPQGSLLFLPLHFYSLLFKGS